MPFATEIHPVPTSLAESGADLLALPVRAGDDAPVPVLSGAGLTAEGLNARLPAPLPDILSLYEFSGKPGEIMEFPTDLGHGLVRVALLGLGAATAADLRKAGAALARQARGRHRVATTVAGALGGDTPEASAALTAFVEGALLASYTFTLESRPKSKGTHPVPVIDLVAGDIESTESAARRGVALARATALARDLVNTPSNVKDPAWLAERAREVAHDANLASAEWDAEALARDGFGAILAVGQGSPRPPRMVRLSYDPPNPSRHVVLVGKGITFDTGGLSLKPTSNMKTMKTDMSGAAIVLGVLSQLAELGSTVKVTGLLPLAENAFSGRAQRPSDVITTYGGRTVEVLNTDAEGRLVLADAMAFAVAELSPDTIVDVATLTGAAKVALGLKTGALYATDDPLAMALLESAERSGERLWRMPLVDDYTGSLRSSVADLANIGTDPHLGRPGAIEAALFLREFTGHVPWAHLDIAGPGRATADEAEITKGGTGFGTRLLLRWLAGE